MKQQTELIEEKWNTYSHALGLLLGILGAFVLVSRENEDQIWPILIYSVSVILLFLASTLYHGARNPIAKGKLRVFDHISIYYLIAGTYTPVCLWILRDSRGELLLWLVWGIAFFGTFLKLFFTGRFEVFSLLLYGVMGWLIVIDLSYLIENMDRTALFYLTLGGVFYTLGMVFYALKRIPFNHLIWHFFVIGGALSHWAMIHSIL